MNAKINLKVLVLDTDFYALESINSYLAWDRRTRVVALTQSMDEALTFLGKVSQAEQPDVILLEAEAFPDPDPLQPPIRQFRQTLKAVPLIFLVHRPHH